MVFSRTLRDHIPCLPYKYAASADWCIMQEPRERMMAKSREVDGEKLARNTKQLRALPAEPVWPLPHPVGQHLGGAGGQAP